MKRRKYQALKNLAHVFSGYSAEPSERRRQGTYRLLTGRNISGLELRLFEHDDFLVTSDRPSFRRCILQEGDILVATLFEERKLYVYKHSDPQVVAGNSLAILRPVKGTFLRDYLNTSYGRERFLQDAARRTLGMTIPRIRIQDFKEIKIPLLQPNEIQNLAQSQLTLVGNELMSLISRGESLKLEFKATLRKNLKTKQNDTNIEDAALKTIAAFCNTEGGTLLIGVEDNGDILEIESDGFANLDRFSLHLGNLLKERLKPSPLGSVKYRISAYSGRSVCIVECETTTREIWFASKSGTEPAELYIRVGPSSKPLRGPEITEYCRTHLRY